MHLTEKDGLPDVEFYDILEDKEGMIWLAADKGLFSYDGKNFKNFSHFQKRGLSVFGLKLDVQGRVWCNNLSGQVFYVEKDSLVLFHDFQNDVKGQLAEFKFFNNKVIVSTEKGIYELDKKGLFKKKISKTARLMPTSIKGDTLLSFANDQIFVTTINKKASTQYDLSTHKKSDFNKWEIASLKNNDLIYASSSKSLKTKPRLFYGDGENLKEVVLPKELKGDNTIMKFYNVKDDLWVCTKKGVFIYQIINGRLNYRKTYFEDIPVSRFLKDRNNNYWFTTLTNGVFIIPNLYISKYNIEKRKENITAVSKMSNNTLMMGSVKGDLAFLNKETNKLKYLKNTIKQRVYTITEDKDNLYLSLSKASLIYDKKNNQIIRDNFLYNAKDVTFLDKENILYSTHRTASIININSREELN